MLIHLAVYAVIAATAGLGLTAYTIYIKSRMSTVAAVTGKAAVVQATTNPLSKAWVWLSGWKTIIMGWIAAICGVFSAIPSDMISGWTSLPWASVFDQRLAAIITIVMGMLIPIVHSSGLAKAAVTPPTTES